MAHTGGSSPAPLTMGVSLHALSGEAGLQRVASLIWKTPMTGTSSPQCSFLGDCSLCTVESWTYLGSLEVGDFWGPCQLCCLPPFSKAPLKVVRLGTANMTLQSMVAP